VRDMAKILNVNIVVPDNIGKDEILTIVGAITREGCIVTNATLQTNELRWINGDGFIKLK
jgi:hypothetical protein